MKVSNKDKLTGINIKDFNHYSVVLYSELRTKRDFKSFHLVNIIKNIFFDLYLDEEISFKEFKKLVYPYIKKEKWILIESNEGKSGAIFMG